MPGGQICIEENNENEKKFAGDFVTKTKSFYGNSGVLAPEKHCLLISLQK